MKRSKAVLLAFTILAPTALSAHAASLAQQVRGSTWQLVSLTVDLPNGNKIQPFGPNPIRVQFFDRTGHFITDTLSPDVPKFASNNFRTATDAELLATARGHVSDFGTYRVDEKAKTITFHVTGASFPNWIGTDILDVAEIKANLMTWKAPSGPGQILNTLVWKRVQ